MNKSIESDSVQLQTPATEEQWRAYYYLRWRILRAPWGQPPGSEKDELETGAVHVMASVFSEEVSDPQAFFENRKVVATGRLHIVEPGVGQIRYMAVATDIQGQGLGRRILTVLEQKARQLQLRSICLNARESSLGFYEKMSYRVTGPGPTLYESIKHRKMTKRLSDT